MKIKKFFVAAMLTAPFFFVSCKKNSDTGKQAINTNVYVIGFNSFYTNYPVPYLRLHPKYWKNGISVPLLVHSDTAMANSIFVSGSDVYICGYEYRGKNKVAVYWKNYNQVALTDASVNASASSIYVSGNDVYVGGNLDISGFGPVAVYWKNGNIINLSPSTSSQTATSIFVDNGSVYISGVANLGQSASSLHVAKYWENNTSFPLMNTFEQGYTNSFANSIFVSGQIYIGGSIFNPITSGYHAAIWKQGSLVHLPELPGSSSSTINAVFISAGLQEYAAGKDRNEAVYWKNGQEIELHYLVAGDAGANSIYVTGKEDVYVAGYAPGNNFYTAVYWKNGKENVLPDGDQATGIWVQ